MKATILLGCSPKWWIVTVDDDDLQVMNPTVVGGWAYPVWFRCFAEWTKCRFLTGEEFCFLLLEAMTLNRYKSRWQWRPRMAIITHHYSPFSSTINQCHSWLSRRNHFQPLFLVSYHCCWFMVVRCHSTSSPTHPTPSPGIMCPGIFTEPVAPGRAACERSTSGLPVANRWQAAANKWTWIITKDSCW